MPEFRAKRGKYSPITLGDFRRATKDLPDDTELFDAAKNLHHTPFARVDICPLQRGGTSLSRGQYVTEECQQRLALHDGIFVSCSPIKPAVVLVPPELLATEEERTKWQRYNPWDKSRRRR